MIQVQMGARAFFDESIRPPSSSSPRQNHLYVLAATLVPIADIGADRARIRRFWTRPRHFHWIKESTEDRLAMLDLMAGMARSTYVTSSPFVNTRDQERVRARLLGYLVV